MRNRTIIENVKPELDGGRYFIKRVPGERIDVEADIFGDGHDVIRASLLYRAVGKKKWEEVSMQGYPNDLWKASFTPAGQGFYEYTIEAWIDPLSTWHHGFVKKLEDGQHMGVELQIGSQLLKNAATLYSKAKAAPLLKFAKLLEDEKGYTESVNAVISNEFEHTLEDLPYKNFPTIYDRELRVRVGSPRELFSTWYEFFPRSASQTPGKHGSFEDVERLLPRVVEMGFDVLYLPPIHPIGEKNRKGKNNAVTAQPGEPGSPWAIGSKDGGHKAIHKELGTLEDYKNLIKKANSMGVDIALDLAFQCAPDHPYITEHPEWFNWRPDGSIAYAENPPKKYQDIVPLNFECDAWEALWQELKEVTLFWVKQGVRIFRVDNPHTKPILFWKWLIAEVQAVEPNTIFLSEAFTRPKIMASLAKVGFTQGYTYFIWRNSRKEMEEYLTEISQSELREFFRPNFWPNTPDILPYELMGAGSNSFVQRLIMAATLSSNFGMYGPAYEFLDNRGNFNGKEEYLDSEKYEIKAYDWNHRNRLTDTITRVNQIRHQHPALHDTYNIHFTRTDNDKLMSYVKMSPDRSSIIWCIVSWDPIHNQAGFVEVPKELLGIHGRVNLQVQDLLTNEVYHWFNDWNFIELNPHRFPAHIFRVQL